ncbi:MAG TPA: NAD-glutamate dehydrogenase [Actinomycetes bacterium]|nr:NAD-glutamate dehydrogenase [Actinomycetes bacterium]
MSTQPEQAKAEILQQIVATINEKVPEDRREQVEEFARQYYGRLAPEDLVELDPDDLYGAVLAHWRLAHRRQPGEALVRVYSPRFEEHGWRSRHSIVEIVTDDMPFLVDSVAMELNRNGLVIHLPIHPVVVVRRDEAGGLVEVLPPDAEDGIPESYLHFEVDRQSEPEVLDRLRSEVERILEDVKASTEDWAEMREQVRSILAELAERPPPVDEAELAEARALLEWIEDHHFTFLGYRSYDLVKEKGQDMLRPVPGTGLGILRQGQSKPASGSFAKLPPEARRLAREPHILVLTKANSHSTVHRPSYLDYIGVKRFDEQGEVVGERRFLGLYTSAAYNRNPRDIPVLRRKVTEVLERAGLPRYSHDWKSLLNILETFPRDELFQISDDQLFETAMGILRLEERRRVRLFMWHDDYGRFVSCVVYVPRDRYTTTVRRRIEVVLHEAFPGANFDFQVWLSESVLARLHFIIRVPPGEMPSYDAKDLEAKLATVTRSWNDELHTLLLELHGEEEGNALYSSYGEAFPAAYLDDFPARNAVYDIQRMEDLAERGGLNMNLYRPLEAPAGTLRFKLFWADRPLPLSDAVPMLEDMGVEVVEERPYELHPPGQGPVWIHDFGVTYTGDGDVDLGRVRDVFQDAFAAILRGEAESDGFNRLVLRARLGWRQIVVLRAYCKYLRQTRLAFSQEYMVQALAGNPQIARWLVELFESRFDPTQPEGAEARADKLRERLADSIDQVANLDEDRILRSFLGMVEATLRTNFFQDGPDGEPKRYLSVKLDPAQVPSLPKPRPMFEVFVYSPRTEAVHLRGGKVARGGIRWSDRREDFRTEILGLMKAQMVKNAVIVPVGAKGGFVVKQPPAEGGREALMDEVVACYSTMMRGLLDITDNRVDGKVVPPADVVRYDDDDPYLVVAADKGTATFSDLANSIAQEYGFWLDDAFASGGSAGYDHKKMGITARGAWESVKQLFRETGLDTQSTDFTVVGIGDMSGDVFGNGMLLSRHIKLVGAFNHLHVFLDPDPDPEVGLAERERLFALPRSSWSDYDTGKISEGGGVWPRSAKSIPLSEQVRRALDVQTEALTPTELINAMLKAPVDLLWNGGIGTYVKAAREAHGDVGDRTNDAVRVNGGELQAKVVGEGGNLGFTQLGRIEYALHGGRINTDFIDNSGGVDCSDHEVNIKILLNQVVADGDMTRKQRDKLLADMTDDVATAVLQDNYRQVQAISVTEAQAPQLLDEHARLMRRLEFLPNNEELAERRAAGKGLTRPELAVLLAYAKIVLQDELVTSDVPEDEYLADDLERYMPPKLREKFRKQLRRHPLRRDIIATYVTNSMVNRAGSTFANRLRDETGARPPDVARAYTVAREVFNIRRLWKDLATLDTVVPADVQLELQAEGRKMIERSALWFLRNRRQPMDIAATVSHFAPGVASLAQELPKLLAPADSESLEQLAERVTAAGVPPELATRVASLDALFSGLNVIEVATACGETVETVAAVYFALGYKLDLHWLRDQIAKLPGETHWQTLAQGALRDDLYSEQRELTTEVLKPGTEDAEDQDAETLIDAWLEENASAVERANAILSDLKEAETLDIAMLSVALREIRTLSETGSATTGTPATP